MDCLPSTEGLATVCGCFFGRMISSPTMVRRISSVFPLTSVGVGASTTRTIRCNIFDGSIGFGRRLFSRAILESPLRPGNDLHGLNRRIGCGGRWIYGSSICEANMAARILQGIHITPLSSLDRGFCYFCQKAIGDFVESAL